MALKTFSFHELLDYILLESVFAYDPFTNTTRIVEGYSTIWIPTIKQMNSLQADRSVILVGKKVYSFLTCQGVTSRKIGYGVYILPADVWC